MAQDTGRIIGNLEADVRNLRSAVEALTEQVEGLRADFHERRGAWKLFLWVAGAFGGVAGYLVTSLKIWLTT